jgi:hypothetical protein
MGDGSDDAANIKPESETGTRVGEEQVRDVG